MDELRNEILRKVDRLNNEFGIKKITIAKELGYRSTTALFKTVKFGKYRDKLLNLTQLLDFIIKKYSKK